MSTIKLFCGNANPALAKGVADHLGLPLGKIAVDRFSDGETMVEIQENVRGCDIFILQSICTPCNEHLMEIMIMADAFRRASAHHITAVIPYFGYSRQDRRVRSIRVPISAKVVADMLVGVGITRVITIDLHAEQIQGFFNIPVDNVYSTPGMLEDIKKHVKNSPMIVSPDVGGVLRARAVAKRLHDADLAIIDKRRPGRNRAEVMNIIGEVDGRICVIVDDMLDTGGTLCQAAAALKKAGAAKVFAYCTHPVLSGPVIKNIEASVVDELVVGDTIPLSKAAEKCPKIRLLSLSLLLGETIRRVSTQESLSSMFLE